MQLPNPSAGRGFRPANLEPPSLLYRYFDDAAHAERLTQGYVWLSTFERCRNANNAFHDTGEGRVSWHPARADSATEPERTEALRQEHARAGQIVIESLNVKRLIFNARIGSEVDDAFMLCTSLSPDIKPRLFGPFIVEIRSPASFFCAVSAQIEQRFGFAQDPIFGPVTYVARHSKGDKYPALAPEFAGDPGNAQEQEARMVWKPKDRTALAAFELHVPDAAQYCRRLA